MRRLLPPSAILLLLAAAYAPTPHGQIRSVRQIAPGVFTRFGDRDVRQPANTSWIEFRDFVVVIEANTPWGIRDSLPEIQKTTSKPIRYVFDTHYHWDHTQGNSVLADKGVTVVCSQDCASELAVKGKTEWDQMSKSTDYSLAPYRLQQPSVVFGDFMAFDDGERRLELRRVGPAHTIGDAVAFLPKEGILFTGDLCVNWRSGNNVGDRDADHQHWVQVLNDLARWDVKTVVPGHGELGTVATLRAQSAFLDDLWTRVAGGKKAGKSLEQLLKEVDLAKHGDFAADERQNQSAIRAVFRKAPEPQAGQATVAPAPGQRGSGPPTRDPATPGYVKATDLPDGDVPPMNVNGNFIIGPTHSPSADAIEKEGIAKGTVQVFTMNSADSKIYPGIIRLPGERQEDPGNPAILNVQSGPGPYTRRVAVYVPAGYTPGTIAPFIVGADGPDQLLFTALDNLIAQKKLPPIVAISIGNGGSDAQGSQRGLEYDTMSGKYAEFVETEVLPLVEKQFNVRLTRDPNSRATMGCSSGAAAALSMAWYRTDLYHRVLSYSGTFVNQQWPWNAETPGGAWEYHRTLIPNTPKKPLRIWLHISDRDNLSASRTDNMHDWVLANQHMARVLADKGYDYQFTFSRNAGHCDRAVKLQTLPQALQWVWYGHPVDAKLQR